MTYLPPPLLAIAGASDILQNGMDTAQSIAESWNQQWLNIFQSELYNVIVFTSGLFAAFAAVFFMIQFLRRMIIDEDWTSGLQSLLPVILILMLLANNGYMLSRGTLLMRGIIHNLSDSILSVTLLEVSLQDAIQSATVSGAVRSEISAQLSQCQGMVGAKQIECLQAANEQVKATLDAYENRIRLPAAIRDISRAIEGAISVGEAEDNRLSSAIFGTAGFFGGFLGSVSQTIIQSVLLAFQWAFANLLEISLLLTGLMGPFAVAGGLMFDAKPFFGWLTGFFSIGMAQVSYNIIVGLSAVVVVNAEVSDTLGFLVIISLLAPALALALAAGGGIVVFQVINSGSVHLLSTLASHFPKFSKA